MSPEIRALISLASYDHEGIRKIAALLPAEDGVLDEWLATAVERAERDSFILLVTAALHLERRVDARHLAGGLTLLPHFLTVGSFAWHMTGDVDVHLMTAVRESSLRYSCSAAALLCAVAWAKENRGGALPPGIAADARKLARDGASDNNTAPFLYALGQALPDESILQIIAAQRPDIRQDQAIELSQKASDEFLKAVRGEALAIVPEKYVPEKVTGATQRRSVEKVGRNDPCPCGSGRKYKQCCTNKDHERLLRSSTVPGKTIEEIEACPEPHVTAASVGKLDIWQLTHLNPLLLKPEVLREYLSALSVLPQPDAIVSAFERLGYREEFQLIWAWACIASYHANRKDAVERLLALRGGLDAVGDEFPAGARLLLQRDDPAGFLREAEALALDALKTGDEEKLLNFATGFASTQTPALGIFVARSVIPITDNVSATNILGRILAAHDRLGLSPDDPFANIVEKRLTDKTVGEHGKDSQALRTARDRLEAKAGEVNRLKAELLRTRNEMERRAQARTASAASHPTVRTSLPPTDDSADLRRKVTELKALLNERHAERTHLRHEISKAQEELDAARHAARPTLPAESAAHGTDTEHEHLLPAEEHGTQPVRLIEFPHKFHITLDTLPRPVASTAMQMLGRLASGESSAFSGVVRLKANREIYRQRIGSDHRLLFRLSSTHLEVVDLINRRDLDLRIKSLRAD